VIKRELTGAGVAAEVLRFGMDGAPLSQYLHLLRREVRAFKPDVVLVQLIHNDFDESYRFLETRYASSFLKIGFDQAGRPFEIEPADSRPGMADRLRAFNTFRYLYYKTNAYLRFKRFVSRYWWGGEEEYAPQFVSSAVDVRKIADHVNNRRVARGCCWRWMGCAMPSTPARRLIATRWASAMASSAKSQASSTSPSSICTQPLPTTTPATSNASSLPTTGIGTC
jgi:hypothetical protein